MSTHFTKAQVRVLETLAAASQPLSKKEIGTTSSTLETLVAERAVIKLVEEREGEDEPAITFSISNSGTAVLQEIAAAQAEREAATADKPQRTLSDTLIRCLAILEDGKWHSFRDLNTSSQNHARLVEKGLAETERTEEGAKKFRITDHGRQELAANRD